MIELPKPTYIWHEDKDDETSCEMFEVEFSGLVDTSEIYPSGKCSHCTRLYTEAQMLQFRKDTLEEAANMCITLYNNDSTNILYCARMIKELKETK